MYEMGVLGLKEVVKTVYDELKLEAENKGLEINLDFNKNINDRVYVDKDRIFEVVYNLINNAIKYTDKGSVNIKLRQKNKKIIVFEVTDTGLGIAKKDQGKLFNKFIRAESGTRKIIGTGLGLYISKLLVEKFKGTIGFESKLNKGSRFWFELPIKIS